MKVDAIPFDEAGLWIAKKPIFTKQVFAGLLPELKARAFVISGIESFDVLVQAREVLAGLPLGANWEDAKLQLVELMSPFFSPKAALSRAELLLRTHGYQAYAVANFRALEEAKDLFPYRQYVSSDDPRVRPAHAALHMRIFPADSPFWATHTPPWQWRCRCDVIGLTEDEAMAQKELDKDSKDVAARLFMEGKPLESVEKSNILHLPGGLTFDLSTDFAKKDGGGYYFEPGSMGLPLSVILERYPADVAAEFEGWAKDQQVEELKMSVWDWLVGVEKKKLAKLDQSRPRNQPTPTPEKKVRKPRAKAFAGHLAGLKFE